MDRIWSEWGIQRNEAEKGAACAAIWSSRGRPADVSGNEAGRGGRLTRGDRRPTAACESRFEDDRFDIGDCGDVDRMLDDQESTIGIDSIEILAIRLFLLPVELQT